MDKDILNEILIEAIDKNFPKGKCKERGNALMLIAQVLIDSKPYLNTRAVKKLNVDEVIELMELSKYKCWTWDINDKFTLATAICALKDKGDSNG